MSTNTARISHTNDHTVFHEADRVMDDIKTDLLGLEALGADHFDIERLIEDKTRELKRALLQAHLDHRAALEQRVDVRGSDSAERAASRSSTRKLETVFGEVRVSRQLYQAPGVDGLAPMDAALNLPAERYSHGIRRFAAEEAARSSFDEVVEQLEKRTGAHVPKRQVEELARRAARDFDAFYSERAAATEETDDLLIVSLDGKGVAMRYEDLRPATRKAAREAQPRLDTRLAPGEKPNRKRMATVATVYSLARWRRTPADVLHTLRDDDVERDRPKPSNKRVWASLEQTAQRVAYDAFAEAARRDPERRRRWVVLVDGLPSQLRCVRRAARKYKVEVTIVLDIVHVLEYLWRASYAFHPQGTEAAQEWVRHRLFALLRGRTGGQVARSIRQMAARRDLPADKLAAVERCAGYLVKHTRWLHYDRALADGLPIATGVIEGACRHLVGDRMGRSGARWSLAGGEAILRLRALRVSGDFDAYWAFHLTKERERTHEARYAGGKPPSPLPGPRPSLRLVK
jgi:hypothetical protein